jgi:hypothetical protein
MNHLIHCSCGEVIVKSAVDTKIRAKILVFKDDGAFAVCKSCDQEIKVPLQIDTDLLKSMSAVSEKLHVPLYVRRNVKGSTKNS